MRRIGGHEGMNVYRCDDGTIVKIAEGAECEALLRKGLVIGAEVAPSPLVLGRIER